MTRIRLALLIVVLILFVSVPCRALDRVVVVDDRYDYDPWLASGYHISGTPTKFDNLVKRSNLVGNWTSCELVNYGDEQKITFSWEGAGDSMYQKLMVNSYVERVIATSAPQGTFRFEILELLNCTFTIDLGSRELHYSTPGL